MGEDTGVTMRTIDKDIFYQATGLLYLAKKLSSQADAYTKALAGILGEEDESGHCSDAVFGYDHSIEDLLSRLNIEVDWDKE